MNNTTQYILPSTLVPCNNYITKPMSEIVVGDKVITQNGEEQVVKNISSKEINEDVYKLSIQSENIPINITANSILYAIRSQNVSCKFKLKNARPQKCTFLFRKSCSTTKNPKCAINKLEIQETIASDLKENDYLVCPVYRKNNSIPQDININRIRLLGYYAAEGCTNINKKKSVFCVQFTLNINEKETLAKEILELVKIEFESNVGCYNYHKHQNTLTLKFQNENAINFFMKYCPGKATTKAFNKDILNLPNEFQKNLIACYILGDGHFKIKNDVLKEISITSASYNLVNQVKNMIYQFGMGTAKIAEKENTINNKTFKSYILSFSNCTANVLSNYFKHVTFPISKNNVTKNSCLILDGYVLKRINHINKTQYHGIAYNLETNIENNIVVNGIVCGI